MKNLMKNYSVLKLRETRIYRYHDLSSKTTTNLEIITPEIQNCVIIKYKLQIQQNMIHYLIFQPINLFLKNHSLKLHVCVTR